jgi:Tfp pilus assembly protein PilF
MIPRAIPLAALLLACAGGVQAQIGPAGKVLMDQANYWYAQNKPEEAAGALDRLLRLEPDNPDALGLLAQLQAMQGDSAKAQATLAHLRKVHAEDRNIPRAEQAIRVGSIDPGALADARQLARDGHNAEAIARYKSLFQGAAPPDSLAVEYYQTLSGTEGGWDAARDGLAQATAAAPSDTRAQIAYAQLLTYRDQTRADGIARLAALARTPQNAPAAEKAWRQALEWMPTDAPGIPAYEAWLELHPNDAAISQRLELARNPPQSPPDQAAVKRSAGFAALSAGRIAAAEADFQTALAQNPEDPDALGGLGLVRLRQGNVADARTLLSRAIAADPAHKSRWDSALRGASVGQDYAAARTMIQRGQFDAAERQLRTIIASGGDVTGAQLMLADALSRGGDLPAAETEFRTVLSRQANNTDALVGLAQVLNLQGRASEASAVLDRAESAGNGRVAERVRADAMRQQATAATDPLTKEALLRAASASDPGDPWTRLDLARVLSANGKKTEARQVMAEATDGAKPSVDALRSAAIFAAEDARPTDAAALIARLPPAARTPDMRALLAQAAVQTDIVNALSLAATSRSAARERLFGLAAQPDPDGARGVAIARAFMQMQDPAGARQALAIAQATTRVPNAAQRIAYAGALLQAGDQSGAEILINTLDSTSKLTPDQAAALNRLRAGAAIRAADTLNGEHRQAAAYDVLAPALARDPGNADLNLALGRLYGAADQPRKALAINQSVLARDPGNLDARKAALGAAIQARDWAGAEKLVHDAAAIAPDDPQTWAMSATLAQARGSQRQAVKDLERARALRLQELGLEQSTASGFPAAVSSQGRTLRMARNDTFVSDTGNPFRADAATPEAPDPGLTVAQAGAGDPLLQNLDQQLAAARQDLAPNITFGPELRSRTGTNGLDQLSEVSLPTELIARPFGSGVLTAGATPTFLSAGTVPADFNSQARFGTGVFTGHPAPSGQTAQGVGLSLGYRIDWLKADVGSSPIGFVEQNLLGGVELAPHLSDNVVLRLTGERRAVTDSVLAFAGTKDPGTGISWGGVTRTRGHGQLEVAVGAANLYVGGGYAAVDGTNVTSNQEYEAGAGGSYPIWRDQTDELRLGMDIVYFGYSKNLDFFTLGQGGYFSPQSYFATLLPLTYTSKHDDLTWSFGGALGYQVYNEDASPVFPNNPELQNSLVVLAANSAAPILTSYPGANASGVVGNVHGTIEYHFNNFFSIGGQASYQHAGNWSEAIGRMFARYIFDGGSL